MDLYLLLCTVLLVCLLIWAARSFDFPQPVLWIVGVVVLIALIYALFNVLGINTMSMHSRHVLR